MYDFVICPSYHGATVLSCLLNNHSQVTSLGDLVPVQRMLAHTRCSCGDLVTECEFWKQIETRVNPDRIYRDGHLLPVYPTVLQNETLNRIAMRGVGLVSTYGSPSAWRAMSRSTEEYVDGFRRLYASALELQGTSRFLDGQKNLAKIQVFMATAGYERVRVLHLLRDPRAAYFSNLRHNREVEPTSFGRTWRRLHARYAAVGRRLGPANYYQLRHEDLCAEPGPTMDAIQDFFGLPRENLLQASTAGLRKHVIGNEMLATFDGNVVQDERWRDLPSGVQRAVAESAQPLFTEFGYQVDAVGSSGQLKG